MGSLRSEAVDTIVFTDKTNDFKAEITFGKVKKKYLCLNLDQLTTSNHQFIIREKPFAVLMELIVDILTLIRLDIGTGGS